MWPTPHRPARRPPPPPPPPPPRPPPPHPRHPARPGCRRPPIRARSTGPARRAAVGRHLRSPHRPAALPSASTHTLLLPSVANLPSPITPRHIVVRQPGPIARFFMIVVDVGCYAVKTHHDHEAGRSRAAG